jgi:hypothetical protein
VRLRRTAAALALVAAVTGCGSVSDERGDTADPLVPATELDDLLLSTDEVNAVMGTDAMVASPARIEPDDNRILLPNVDCLGLLLVGEKAIYGDSGFTAIRTQLLRQPDNSEWDALVMQGAATFLSSDAATAFFDASAERWSRCTNHRVNLSSNIQPAMSWMFGELAESESELVMTLTRGANERACQRVLSVEFNVTIDVRACSHSIDDQAATITQDIKERLPS